MTSRQRVLDAVFHRETDRVPITFDAEEEVYGALYAHLKLESKEALFDRLNVDTWMMLPGNFMYPEPPSHSPATPSTTDLHGNSDEPRNGNEEERTTIWGYRTKLMRYAGGSYDGATFFPLAGKDSISDIASHAWPEPGLLDFSHYPAEAAAHSERAIIGVFTWGAYFIASFVRGLEDLMLDFAMRKKYADHLISTIAEISYAALERMLETAGNSIDIVYMADDYCSHQSPMFSPANFGEFVVPYLRRVVDLTHKHDKKFLLHVCGAVRPLLPQIINCGVDMLEPIQTRANGMDPAGLKRDFGDDLCFYGGVDLQQTLCKGSTQEVADEVRRLIDILGKDGGYILGPGHTYIQVDAPIENILAMYSAALPDSVR